MSALSDEQKAGILAAVQEFFKEFDYESYLEEQVLISHHQTEDLLPQMPYLYGHIRIVGDFYKAVRTSAAPKAVFSPTKMMQP